VSFGFTEPYVKGRPISLGFNIFYQNYQFIGQGFGATTNQKISLAPSDGTSLFTQKTAGSFSHCKRRRCNTLQNASDGQIYQARPFLLLPTTDIVDPQ